MSFLNHLRNGQFVLYYKSTTTKNLSKVVKLQNLVVCVVMCGRYSLTKVANFLIVLRAEIVAIFEPKVVDILFLLSRSKVNLYGNCLLHSHHIFILRTYTWKEHSKNELI